MDTPLTGVSPLSGFSPLSEMSVSKIAGIWRRVDDDLINVYNIGFIRNFDPPETRTY